MLGTGSEHPTAAKICGVGEGASQEGVRGGVQGGRRSTLLTRGTPWGAWSKSMSLLSASRTWQPLGTPLGWQPGAPSPAQVAEGLPAHQTFLELQ